MAQRHEAPRLGRQCRRQDFGSRHGRLVLDARQHPPVRARHHRLFRHRSRHVRQQFPGRQALQLVCHALRRFRERSSPISARATRTRCSAPMRSATTASDEATTPLPSSQGAGTMARFRLLTPDAQYADDGVIERRTAGADVDWDILRERSRGSAADGARWRPATRVVAWHEMKVDARLACHARALPHHRARRRRLRPHRPRRRGRRRHSRLQHAGLRHQRGRRPRHRADAGAAARHRQLSPASGGADPAEGFDYSRAPLVGAAARQGLRRGRARPHRHRHRAARQGLRHDGRRLRSLSSRAAPRSPSASSATRAWRNCWRSATWSACTAR